MHPAHRPLPPPPSAAPHARPIRPPRRHGRARPWTWGAAFAQRAATSHLAAAMLALLLLVGAALAAARPAHASGCDGCAQPSLADLQRQPGFKLESRTHGNSMRIPDRVEMDAGVCQAELIGTPDVEVVDSWLILRGQGEVWNCPHSKSVDTITIQSATSDKTEWTFSVTLGAELGIVGAKLKSEVTAGNATGHTTTDVTTVSKSIAPAPCHRILWKGYFEVVKLKATGEYRFARQWAWWTKNLTTGAKVHAKGTLWVTCGTGTLEMTRTAPISGHFELTQRGCDDPGCRNVRYKQLGMFPPWTPPHDPKGSQPGGSDDAPPPGDDPDSKPQPQAPTPKEAPPAGEKPAGEPPAPDGPIAKQPASSAGLPPPPTGPLPDPLSGPLSGPFSDPLPDPLGGASSPLLPGQPKPPPGPLPDPLARQVAPLAPQPEDTTP